MSAEAEDASADAISAEDASADAISADAISADAISADAIRENLRQGGYHYRVLDVGPLIAMPGGVRVWLAVVDQGETTSRVFARREHWVPAYMRAHGLTANYNNMIVARDEGWVIRYTQ